MAERGVSVKNAAEALTVSVRTVRRLIADDKIRSVLVSKRRRIVPQSEIDRILAGEQRVSA